MCFEPNLEEEYSNKMTKIWHWISTDLYGWMTIHAKLSVIMDDCALHCVEISFVSWRRYETKQVSHHIRKYVCTLLFQICFRVKQFCAIFGLFPPGNASNLYLCRRRQKAEFRLWVSVHCGDLIRVNTLFVGRKGFTDSSVTRKMGF